MSANNGLAQIGTSGIGADTPANKKIPRIGQYIQAAQTPLPISPESDGPYMGVNANTYWDRNWLGEDAGFTVPSNNGPTGTVNVNQIPIVTDTLGGVAIWSTTAATLTVPADGRVAVTGAGIATAASGSGAYEVGIPAATVIPIGAWFWAFTNAT